MTLLDLIQGLPGARTVGDAAIEVAKVTSDSRAVGPRDVFVAIKGLRSDGHAFIPTAIAQGAAAVVVEHEQPGLSVPQVIVPRAAVALGVLTARELGDQRA